MNSSGLNVKGLIPTAKSSIPSVKGPLASAKSTVANVKSTVAPSTSTAATPVKITKSTPLRRAVEIKDVEDVDEVSLQWQASKTIMIRSSSSEGEGTGTGAESGEEDLAEETAEQQLGEQSLCQSKG